MAINIGGISVHFPYKPYPSQLSMMNRTIQSIEKCQNCLLESPTGSGKSLALLCASLAWVEKQIELKNKEYTLEFEDCCFSCDSSGLCNDFEDDCCKSEVPSGKIPCSNCDCHQLQKLSSMSASPTKIPKIFYGTRTHKQISQLIRELKKTKYKDTNMTILSSRSHSCVNKTAIQSNNLTETCQDMIKHAGCEYYLRRKKSESHVKLGKLGLGNAWDIEDLVEVLSKAGSCPYYSARDLIADSLIVFCPYNYLLDPIFRDAVNLNLTNSIVILDEAHNIEDASREAASFSISDDQLNLALKNICDLIAAQVKLDHTMPLKTMVESTLRLMELTKSRLMREGSEDTSQVWTGVEIVGLLKQINLGPETFQIMKKHFTSLCEEESEERSSNEDKESNQLTLKATSKVLFESLFTVLDFIYKDNYKFRDDYRVAVIQSKSFDKPVWRQPNSDSNHLGVWLSNSRQKNAPPQPTVSLNFWCLNSAVIFEDLGRMTRNIVLTSGTLSPLISFQSELGVLFPLRLEAQHVIPENQILVGSIGRGPSGNEICCTYQNSETFLFQDDIGNLILRAIKVVPHGVLCFLPSYSMMDKLINRWQFTGLLNDLKSVKHVMIEPRSSVHYETWIKEFNSYIQASERKFSGENGVLLFAVCRGKVSEGLDFADNRARLVLTIGIPFPNFKDSQVQLKRSYNNSCRTSCRLGEASNLNKNILSQANLLSGSEWYEVQAYRALNQALGRCIRHKDDWGAIIMVDVRFGSNPGRYMSGLSKWLRHRVVHYSHCDTMLESLSSFIKERVGADAACKVSQPPDCEEDDNFRSSLSRFAMNDSDDDDFKIIRRKKKRRRSSDNQEPSVLNCLSNSSNCPQNETSLNTQSTDVVVDLTFDDNNLDSSSSFQCLRNTESTSYMPFNETLAFRKPKKPLQARSSKKKSLFD